jgi:hypothetical protein
MAANLGKLDLLSTLRTWWPASLVVWGTVELLAFAVNRTRESQRPTDQPPPGASTEEDS